MAHFIKLAAGDTVKIPEHSKVSKVIIDDAELRPERVTISWTFTDLIDAINHAATQLNQQKYGYQAVKWVSNLALTPGNQGYVSGIGWATITGVMWNTD